MSSICGIFYRDGRAASQESIADMTATLNHWQADNIGIWRNPTGAIALGHVQLTNTPESLQETLPFFHAASRLTITADARIDNRIDLYRELEIPLPEQRLLPDSRLILQAYQKWGRQCPVHLIGDYTFAIWDEGEKQLFCARDHLGNKPLFYFAAADSFIFATEMKGIFKVANLSRALDQRWVADMLTARVTDNEYTPYPDIRRLPPAHGFSISQREIKKERYWQPDMETELRLHFENDYVEAFREKLTEAVRCRVRSAFPVGAELSGGLDSSAVAALAAGQAEALNLKFITFSHVLGKADQARAGKEKDEKEFQDILRRHARINHAHSLTAQDRGVIETLRNTQRIQDGLSHRDYGTLTDVIFEAAARDRVRTLLSGFGGDEGVTNQAGIYLNELACRRAWQELWKEYGQLPAKRQPIFIITFLLKMAGEYAPTFKTIYRRFRDRLRKARNPFYVNYLEEFLLTSEFYQAADIHRRIIATPRNPHVADLRASQCWRVTHTHVPARLEYSSIEAAAHRLEYRYPLLDIRLIEFHLATPSRLKRKNGYGRYLFRKAIEGIVPPEIQWRDDKRRAAVPAVRHRFIRDARAIEDLILRSKHSQAADYINLEQMLKSLEQIVNMDTNPVQVRQGILLNALKMLLYFDHQ